MTERSPWTKLRNRARLKVDGTSLPVAEELRLNGEPGMSSGGALGGDVLRKVVSESGDAIHPGPVRRDRGRRVVANMILKRELAEDKQQLMLKLPESTSRVTWFRMLLTATACA